LNPVISTYFNHIEDCSIHHIAFHIKFHWLSIYRRGSAASTMVYPFRHFFTQTSTVFTWTHSQGPYPTLLKILSSVIQSFITITID
jgi:hypothetical protein